MLTTLLLMGFAIGSHPAEAGSELAPVRASTPAVATRDTSFAKQISMGEVTLVLGPVWRDGEFVLEVRANTHSVDLGEIKLDEAVRLVIGETSIAPSHAGSLSGHHGSASVVFPLAEVPTSFTVEIRDVPDVPVRTLSWGAPTPQR